MLRSVGFNIVLEDGYIYNHNTIVDADILDKEEIKKQCFEDLYNDVIRIELDLPTRIDINKDIKKAKRKNNFER